MKGYTVGDNTNKDEAKHPWLMDDEKVTYRPRDVQKNGPARSNLRYSYVNGPVDWSAFA